MLQSKQYTHFSSLPTVNNDISFTDYLPRVWEKICYLVRPVDSTDQPGSRKYRAILRKRGKVLSVVKGLWWMLVAIGIPLIIAQLGGS